jgi:hypothetical protein
MTTLTRPRFGTYALYYCLSDLLAHHHDGQIHLTCDTDTAITAFYRNKKMDFPIRIATTHYLAIKKGYTK